MAFLEVKNLCCKYDKTIFKNLSFALNEGEILIIHGKSGVGKTTLLRALTGLIESSGEILINGIDISNFKTEKRNIGLVFQDYALFPHLTVFKNISFGIKNKKDVNNEVNKLLEIIDMKSYENKYPYELSGGQQQRVAIARALASKPSILLMDEPFSNLDNELKTSIIEHIIDILKKLKITTIIVSHNLNDYSFADKLLEIKS